MTVRLPWIHSAALDIPFVLAPPFILLVVVGLFPDRFGPNVTFSEWHWVGLVLLIDVAHVYSTLYRTYLDPLARRHFRFELTWAPLIAFIVMVVLHSMDPRWFWRILAYLAVFHFVRQQYGFMRLYQRGERAPMWKHRVDAITIYAVTLLPLLHWHATYPKRFNWFMPDDMLGFDQPRLASIILLIHAGCLLGYLTSEWIMARQGNVINLPKNLLMAGTALSWYMGIVHFNGDVTFTLFNVVAHGVPYMALVWAYGHKRSSNPGPGSAVLRILFTRRGIPIFLGVIFLFAFVEEGFWEALVWREGRPVFVLFNEVLPVIDQQALLSILVPLLALPQVTHYIIDAFIWRMRKENDRDGWQRAVFGGHGTE